MIVFVLPSPTLTTERATATYAVADATGAIVARFAKESEARSFAAHYDPDRNVNVLAAVAFRNFA